MTRKPPKKTETIEIRLSHELKSALADLSRSQHRTMSETVRALIERRVDGPVSQHATGDLPMRHTVITRNLRSAALALPVLVLAALYVLAGQGPATASEEARVFFAELDRDGDGEIVLDEVLAFAEADGWEVDDACATGSAPADEPCTLAALVDERFAASDANGDGRVVYAELEALVLRDRAAQFLEADLDENGFVTLDEFAAIEVFWYADEPDIAREDGVQLSDACLAQLEAEELAGIAATCGIAEFARIEVAIFDTDRDGQVSLMEFLSR